MKKINLFLDTQSDVYFNTKKEDAELGHNKTFTRATYPNSEEYTVGTALGDIIASKVIIAETGTTWEITFTY